MLQAGLVLAPYYAESRPRSSHTIRIFVPRASPDCENAESRMGDRGDGAYLWNAQGQGSPKSVKFEGPDASR